MTGLDVEPDMTRASVVDQKITALLAGKAPADPEAVELALMCDSITHAFPLPAISELSEDVHLARMMQMALPVTAITQPVPVRSSRLASLKAASSRRVAVATLAFSTAFGGAAYAGVLPESLQDVVGQAASTTGVHLLTSEDLDETPSDKDKDPEPQLEADDSAGSKHDDPNGSEGHAGDADGKGEKDESPGSDDEDEAQEADGSDDGDEGDGDEGDDSENDGDANDSDANDDSENDGDENDDRDASEDSDDDARPHEEDEPEGPDEGDNDPESDDQTQDAEYDQSNGLDNLGDGADDAINDDATETDD